MKFIQIRRVSTTKMAEETFMQMMKREFKEDVIPFMKLIGISFLVAAVYLFIMLVFNQPGLGSLAPLIILGGVAVFILVSGKKTFDKARKLHREYKEQEQKAFDPENYKK